MIRILFILIFVLHNTLALADSQSYQVNLADGSTTVNANNKGENCHEITIKYPLGTTITSGTLTVEARPRNSDSYFPIKELTLAYLTNPLFSRFSGNVDFFKFTFSDVSGASQAVITDTFHNNCDQNLWYGKPLSANNPFPTDGDSVYAKDIDNDAHTSIGTFTGDIFSLFNNYDNEIIDSTATNPKTFTIRFERPILASSIGFGSGTGDFSNVKILLEDLSGTVRKIVDDSSNNTKYTSNVYPFSPSVFIEMVVEFHTEDAVSLNGMLIEKDRGVVARLKALKPDGTVTDIDATAGGNLKVSVEEGDNAASPVTVLPGDGTNNVDIVSHEGEVGIRVVSGGEAIGRVHIDEANISATTAFMVIDLSDTTNWPHTNTGHVEIVNIVININPSAAFLGDISLGFLSGVDATNGDFNRLKTWHLQQGSNNINQCCGWEFSHYSCELTEWFGPTNANSVLFQTDVNLNGPDGATSYPSGNGDLTMLVEVSAGNVDIGLTVAYKTAAQ